MKEDKSLIFFCGCVLTILGVNYILGITLPNSSYKDLIMEMVSSCIILLFFSGYLLYSWKSNMAELLKRVRLAIPLAVIVSIFAIIMKFGTYLGIIGGLFTFFLLILKAKNRKQHFTVIMTLALTSVIVLKLDQILLPDEGGQMTYLFLRIVLTLACSMLILVFFLQYMSKLLKTDILDIRAILIKSLKLTIAIIVLFIAFHILSDFGGERGISLTIRILASSLLSICFLVICYKLDILPYERKKNKINELQEELNDFYLEEKAKLKEKESSLD